ncbi:MAG: phosphatidylserine decarboxylase family protein [Janthinobacterium lividum]
MVRDGYFYALGFVLVAALLWKLTGSIGLAALPLLLVLFFLWFFRDPSRSITTQPGALVSPADGKVTEAEWIETPDGSRLRLSIFLNVFDVHVNRSPIAGTVTQVNHKRGMFLNAMRADSNVLNEQTVMVVEGADGTAVQVKQIAGLLARRIVCNVKPGDRVERGERFGLIKFGSRVDLLLPSNANLLVRTGDRVKGGSTVLATLAPATDQVVEG